MKINLKNFGFLEILVSIFPIFVIGTCFNSPHVASRNNKLNSIYK